jgi:hypothetical protein
VGSDEGSVEGVGSGVGSADGSAADTNAGPSRLIHRIATCNRTTVVDATRRRREEPLVNIDLTPTSGLRRLVRPLRRALPNAPLFGRSLPMLLCVRERFIGGTTEAGTDSLVRTLTFCCRVAPSPAPNAGIRIRRSCCGLARASLGQAVASSGWAGGGVSRRSRTRRRSWALAATTMVEALMAIAPTDIGRSIPHGTKRPMATGMAIKL